MRKTKLTSLIVALTLVLQLFSAMTLSVSAAQYDKIGEYVSTAWNGRAFDTAFAEFNGKTYAYVGTTNAGGAGGGNTGGIAVLDITNPAAITQVQVIEDGSIFLRDNAETRDKLYVKDDCLYVLNGANAQLQIFRINTEDGKINTSAIWSSGEISVQGKGTIKVAGNLMFVGTYYTDNPTMRVYDISDSDNPVLLSTETPIYPSMIASGDFNASNCSKQIGTTSFDVEDKGNGVYRVYANNRAIFNSGADDRIFLSIRDITVSGSSYTVNTLYEGQPANTSYAIGCGWSVYDVEVVNSNTIAIADGYNNSKTDYSLQIIDVSTPTAPVLAVANDDNHEGLDVYSDGEIIAIAKKGSGTNVYTYDSSTKSLTKVKGISPSSWSCDFGEYAGHLYITGHNVFTMYEYKTGISIDNSDVKAIGGTITGTVKGYISSTDTVNVNVGGTTYTATVSGSKFSVNLDEISGQSVSVTASLIRNGSAVSTDTKTLDVVVLGNKMYNDLSKLSSVAEIPTSTGRHTDAIGLNVADKKLVYAQTDAGLEILDITDINDVKVTTNTSIKGKTYNSQMQIKDGYLIATDYSNYRQIKFYKINTDGSIASEPAQTIGGTNGTDPTTIEIVDDYLFEAQQGASKTINVYDVSDIASGVKFLGNLGTTCGVYGLEVQKISDNLYRAYFISRASAWTFCISDMAVANDGTVSFTERYNGDIGTFDYSSVKDIEYIGDNKIVIGDASNNGHKVTVDVSNPENPVATIVDVRLQAAKVFGDEYYVFGQGGSLTNVAIYDKDDKVIKDLYTTSQIYNISEFDGKLLVSTQGGLYIYDGLYTGIEVDETNIQLVSTVKISGNVIGYKTGDSVKMTVNGAEYSATIDSQGNFYCNYSPLQPETVSVTASLIRNGNVVLVDAGTVKIVNEYSELPEAVVDTGLTVLSTTKPVDETSAEIWSNSNRASSVAVTEINGKDIAYVLSYTNLIVYDITNPQSPVLLQNNVLTSYANTQPRPKFVAVKDDHIFVVHGAQKQIYVYGLNQDGTVNLSDSTLLNIGVEIDGITLIDDYMFVGFYHTTGVHIYDISNISSIKDIGSHSTVSQGRPSLTVEKVGNVYRAYFIERESSVWNLGIYDITISGGKATFAQKYKGDILTCAEKSSIAQIVKVDADTIAVGETYYTDKNMDLINVANPSAPYIEYSKGYINFQSGSAVSDDCFAFGNKLGVAMLYSLESNSTIASKDFGLGQVYNIVECKGNLVFVCASGMVIATAKTYFDVDSTTIQGASPALTGKVYNFNATTDRLLASVDNSEAQVVAVDSNGNFTLDLSETLDNAASVGVQLVIERQGTNVAGKYYTVNYLGAYPYSITNVTNTDGVKVTIEKNFDTTDNCKVYVAAYTGTKLDDVDVFDVSEGTLSSDVTFNSQTQTLKVFIWNENLVPVAEIAQPSFSAVALNF